MQNKLMISSNCYTSKTYPTFIQLRKRFSDLADAAVDLISRNGWDRVVIVYFFNAHDAPEMEHAYERVKWLLTKRAISLIGNYVVPAQIGQKILEIKLYMPSSNADMVLVKLLTETYLFTRAYLVLSTDVQSQDLYYFLNIAGRMGILQTGEYGVVSVSSQWISITRYNGSEGTKNGQNFMTSSKNRGVPVIYTSLKEDTYQHFRSAALLTEQTPRNYVKWNKYIDRMNAFQAKYKTSPPCPPMCNINLNGMDVSELNLVPSALLYDMLIYFAQRITQLINENKTSITDGYSTKLLFNNLSLINESETGLYIELDEFGSAISSIAVSTAMKASDGVPNIYPIGVYKVRRSGIAQLDTHFDRKLPYNWINGQPPLKAPGCGFDGELCPNVLDKKKFWLIIICTSMIGATIIFLSLFYWRLKVNERKRKLAIWRILLRDLILHDSSHLKRQAAQNVASEHDIMASSATLRMHQSQRDLKSLQDETDDREEQKLLQTAETSVASNAIVERKFLQMFSSKWTEVGSFATALYKGELVGMKRVYKKRITSNLPAEMRDEIILLKSLRHPNVTRLIGVVYESAGVFIISNYCHRGSLKDMLENESIRLDQVFHAAIIFDIIKGLQFLHSTSLGCHGRLKSSNILIDSSWFVQVSDFGLFKFRSDEERPLSEEEKYRELLWTAPELLRGDFTNPSESTDVYSLGIIFHEIYGRQGVYGDFLIDPIAAIQKIKHPKSDEPAFRPLMHHAQDAPEFMRILMKECWSEDPTHRPTLAHLKEKLHPLQVGLSDNVIDNLAKLMQKYSNNLEELVNERVKQIEEEARKADALLVAILPRHVAEALKLGDAVEPEMFEAVTIYFSDIVGFADIMSNYSTYKVIEFLHHVYVNYDALLDEFDVYKVETIGDTYMVVSGLPNRNGDMHAGEIASMALRFIKLAKEGRIRTPAGDLVRIRIGINTGSCVAGVVGLKMPRYCLFGDTVNTASRLESNGQGNMISISQIDYYKIYDSAMKIHISAACKRSLDLLGGYDMIERGIVWMKGKGEVLTYWLVGEDPRIRAHRLESVLAQK